MSKNKFQYAEKDTLPSKIEDKDVTVQISLKIEGDLLKAIRARAAESGMPYQTYMKHAIRQFMKNGRISSLEARLQFIESRLDELQVISKNAQKEILDNEKKRA